jgi:glycosyltransferase involved in cell wall biosynthesis
MIIALVTNGPVPYRIPALNQLAALPGIELHVIFCCKREPNRNWDLPPIEFACTYLQERIIRFSDRYIHNNPDVLPALRRLAPDVVITCGFNPTHLYAFAYAWLRQVPHVVMTDGTYDSEQTLSLLHRMVRRLVFARSSAFVWASIGGKKLFASYGIAAARCFRACLCVENTRFEEQVVEPERRFDFIFCGRMEAVKNPSFAFDVALATAARLKRKTRILYVGDGSEQGRLEERARWHGDTVEASFHGHATQRDLPLLYRSASIFLFPTSWDPWGVVANEACAAGLPVLVTPHAGAAGELIVDGQNGFVCDLDVDVWAERAVLLLTQPATYTAFSGCSLALVKGFTFKIASEGIMAACRHAAAVVRRQ